MAARLEEVRETLTGQSPRRWAPWRRKSARERVAGQVADVAGQVSEGTSDLAGQIGQKTSKLAGRVGLRKRSVGEQMGVAASDVAGFIGQTTSALAGQMGGAALDLRDQAPEVARAGRRWLPWRRKSVGERMAGQVANVAGQVGETAGELAGQLGQTTSELVGRTKERATGLARRATTQTTSAASGVQRRASATAGKVAERFTGGSLPDVGRAAGYESALAGRLYQPFASPADISAERAAGAAELAADAAQRAVGLMERVGGWIGLLANRAAQPVVAAPAAATLADPLLETPRGRHLPGVATPLVLAAGGAPGERPSTVSGRLMRAAATVGERINDLSDGRYGLAPEEPKVEKEALRRLPRKQRKIASRALKEAEKAEEKARKEARGSSLPWLIGLSLGLVAGLVGVAFWQRRHLQQMWEQTSQRMQQATEEVRQRFDAARARQQGMQPGMPLDTTTGQVAQPGMTRETTPFMPLGSAAPVTDLDQQVTGKVESGSQ